MFHFCSLYGRARQDQAKGILYINTKHKFLSSTRLQLYICLPIDLLCGQMHLTERKIYEAKTEGHNKKRVFKR